MGCLDAVSCPESLNLQFLEPGLPQQVYALPSGSCSDLHFKVACFINHSVDLQKASEGAKGQTHESTEGADGSGWAGSAAAPQSKDLCFGMYIRYCCEPRVIFPELPKLNPCCSSMENSFCTAPNRHSCPFSSCCPVPVGCCRQHCAARGGVSSPF